MRVIYCCFNHQRVRDCDAIHAQVNSNKCLCEFGKVAIMFVCVCVGVISHSSCGMIGMKLSIGSNSTPPHRNNAVLKEHPPEGAGVVRCFFS